MMLFPLTLGIHWLISLPRVFFHPDLLLHRSEVLTSQLQARYRRASTSPRSPSPWHQPWRAFKRRGEGGDTKGSGGCSGFDRHAGASKSHSTSWKEGWGAETLWMEKTCQGADILLHRPILKTRQSAQRSYQLQGRQA